MRRSIYLLIILVALIVATITIVLYRYDAELEESVFFAVIYDQNEYRINYWYNDRNNVFYVFLPSFADLNNIVVYTNTHRVYINEISYSNRRNTLTDITLNAEYDFLVHNKYDEVLIDGTITFLQSNNVPTMFINTVSGNMEYVHEGVIRNQNRSAASMLLVNVDGSLEYAGRLSHIQRKRQFFLEI